MIPRLEGLAEGLAEGMCRTRIPWSAGDVVERWVIRGVAKIHPFERAQHSPGGLLPPLRTPHKSTTAHVCLGKNKNFVPQPPGPHVAHADSGVGWSWNAKILEFHRHSGRAEPRHGGALGSKHARPGLLGIGARKRKSAYMP